MNKLRKKYINPILNMTPNSSFTNYTDTAVFSRTLHELTMTISLTHVALLSSHSLYSSYQSFDCPSSTPGTFTFQASTLTPLTC